jgi:uncharacterized protein
MAVSHLARLREIARGGGAAATSARELTYGPVDDEGLPLDARLSEVRTVAGARACVMPYGTCLRVDTVFAADQLHGRVRVTDCQVEVDGCLNVLAGRSHLAGPGRVVYVDLETTGLSGGAGTVPFLVGIGEWSAEGFRTTQFLLPSYASERAMLQAVDEHLTDVALLVTFNGRTFDVPVMEMRGELHRMPQRVCDLPHLDMLHPARRLWRLADDGVRSCRLTHLEEAVLGFGRVGDVPGAEIPGRYFEFIRGGPGALLDPVLLHNRLDLLSLAALTARAQRLVATGRHQPPAGTEASGLGALYERAGLLSESEACYRQVVADRWQPLEARRHAGRSLARLLRRTRRHEEAAAVWMAVVDLGGRPQQMREAREALAVHHEHRARNLDEARRHAEDGVRHAVGRAEREAFARRLARIARKASQRYTGGQLWADDDPRGQA